MPKLNFGQWQPDRSPRDAELLQAHNCIPVNGTYAPYLPVSVNSDTLAETPLSAFYAYDKQGTPVIYLGTASALYQVSDTSFLDKSGTTYSTQLETEWSFTQYNNYVLATNYNDPIQTTLVGGDFVDATEYPRGRVLGTIRDFVVAGDIQEETSSSPNGIRWSAIGDPTDWPIPLTSDAQSKQSGRELLDAAYGKVMHISNGERFGIILQEHGIVRAAYIGGNVVFQFDSYEKTRGAFTRRGNVQIGGLTYFLSEEGFFVTDGSRVKDIGYGRVNTTFWNDFNASKKHLVTAAHDRDNRTVLWSYTSASSTTPDKVLVYSYADDRWTSADQDCHLIFSSVSNQVTLDGLDAYFDSIDDVTPNLDSSYWAGGDTELGAFQSNQMGAFTGAALTATIETGEFTALNGRRAWVKEVYPLIDGGTVFIAMGGRDRLSETRAYTPSRRVNQATGWAPVQSNKAWQTVRTTIQSGFTRADGVEFSARSTGI